MNENSPSNSPSDVVQATIFSSENYCYQEDWV